MRIAVGNKARSGKDTFADLFVSHYPNAQRLAFADSLKVICSDITKLLLDSSQKNPSLLQCVGDGMRKFSPNIWVDATLNKIKEIPTEVPIIVTDVRYLNEMKALQAAGFICVNINRSNRPIDRNPNHPSEIELDTATWDAYLDNNGTLEEFLATCQQYIQGLSAPR